VELDSEEGTEVESVAGGSELEYPVGCARLLRPSTVDGVNAVDGGDEVTIVPDWTLLAVSSLMILFGDDDLIQQSLVRENTGTFYSATRDRFNRTTLSDTDTAN
jgi:hypothetical protein